MIPLDSITHWSQTMAWPSLEQVEQDLLLSRLACEIAQHPLLGDELIFRGGTCLHKVHLPAPLRYSEDLDYVRRSHGPIGPILDAIRTIADTLGMQTVTRVGEHPKALLRSTFETSRRRLQVKIEINTHETSPAWPTTTRAHHVESPWWTGHADIPTFQTPELIATKLRALYQRRKGRDLYDLWIALTQLHLNPTDIITCFAPYRPNNYTPHHAITTLNNHLTHTSFRTDLTDLLAEPTTYNPDTAATLITTQLLEHLDNHNPPK